MRPAGPDRPPTPGRGWAEGSRPGCRLARRDRCPAAGPHVVQPGGGRVRALGAGLTGEPVGEQVGDQQHRPGVPELRRPEGGDQLVDRVERQLLQPVHGVQLGGADLGHHLLPDSVRPTVAMAVGVAEQRPGLVEQPVVDGPRVDPDPVERPGAGDLLEPGEHASVAAPARPTAAGCRPPRRRSGTGAPRVRRGCPRPRRPPSPGHSWRRGRRPRGAAPSSQPSHRRNAAATPASTGTCSPVVWVRSGPQRAKTALAQCSGSTSRLRRVRWA